MSDIALKPEQDLRTYRDVLGTFTTGIAVVTTRVSARSVGMTINSFSSVSLKPPLILWSIDKQASHFDEFCSARHFAVHILAEDQRDLSERFTQKGDEKFSGMKWTLDNLELPVINDCLARLQCRLFQSYEAGDHYILLGEVLQYEVTDGAPLVFARGSYCRLGGVF